MNLWAHFDEGFAIDSMKAHFKEYFYPTEIDKKEVWEDSLIVFDTCALLNLYRYSDKTKNDFISLLDDNKERLWIPYQVAMEFLQNRRTAIKDQEKAYDEIKRGLDNAMNVAKEALNKYKRHVVLDTEDIKNKMETFISDMKKNIQEKREGHPNYNTDDTLLKTITSLYEHKVGDDFDESDLNKLYKDGEKRYKQMLPPGFKDAKNKANGGERYIYGDLIVWKQIIKKSQDEKRNVIFVTDDQKEDWWQKDNGKIISPRLELYREFLLETNQRILIYKADSFLHHSNEYLKNDTKKIPVETIEEVKVVISKPLSFEVLLRNDIQVSDKINLSTFDLSMGSSDKPFNIYAEGYRPDSFRTNPTGLNLKLLNEESVANSILAKPINYGCITQDNESSGSNLSRLKIDCFDKTIGDSILINTQGNQQVFNVDSMPKYCSVSNTLMKDTKDDK